MRIECPSCAAAYIVPDSLVTPGRAVRCARCDGEWVPVSAPPMEIEEAEPPPPEPVAPVITEPEREPEPAPRSTRLSAMDRLAAHPAASHSPPGLRLAWAGSLIVLVLAVGAVFTWRSEIVAAWPPSARAYALFGLQPEANP